MRHQPMLMDYAILKLVHQTSVVLSGTGFLLRGVASLRHAPWVRSRAARTLPHIIDTVLLGSALWLALQWWSLPGGAPWITAKIVGLLVYIGLGIVALGPRRSRPRRIVAFIAAIVVFGWIVSVAITKSPWGFLAGIVPT